MNSFWLFRSNLRPLEYYHQFTDLKTFKEKCHDFYLLMPLYFLEKGYFDQVMIFRLQPESKKQDDIIFDVNGRLFIQKWVNNFSETLNFEKPKITFWRGGFKEYDSITKENPLFFGLKLYLGAGVRILPLYGGIYDLILFEDENDIRLNPKVSGIPFYKTANPHIFKPLNLDKKYDICWPANFSQIKYKGQAYFMNLVGACPFLRNMNIVHCGNEVETAKKMALDCHIKNMDFKGSVSREELNYYLNISKIGINLSNQNDGCPRVSTEILMSGTPLVMKETVRLLEYFKQKGVIVSSDRMMIKKIRNAVSNYRELQKQLLEARKNELSFEKICEKNIEVWQKHER